MQFCQYNVWDYINAELVHNRTYAHRLPPTFIDQARGWANFRENAIFSDPQMGGIGNSRQPRLLFSNLTHTSHSCEPHRPGVGP